jgi:hypothetical protein
MRRSVRQAPSAASTRPPRRTAGRRAVISRAALLSAKRAPNGRRLSLLRHLALFYRGRGEYLSALRGLIRASRARGGAVLVALPKRNAQLVRRELGDDLAQVALVDMAELGRNPARIIPVLLTYAVSIVASTCAASASRSGPAVRPQRCKRQLGMRR